MFADWHEFDVSEAEVTGIAGQGVCKLAIGQPAIAVAAPPRSEMHLVD